MGKGAQHISVDVVASKYRMFCNGKRGRTVLLFFSKSLYIRRGDTKGLAEEQEGRSNCIHASMASSCRWRVFLFSFIGMVAITFVTFLSMVAIILISLFLLSLLTGLTFVLSSRAALQVLRGAPTLVPLLILLCFLL